MEKPRGPRDFQDDDTSWKLDLTAPVRWTTRWKERKTEDVVMWHERTTSNKKDNLKPVWGSEEAQGASVAFCCGQWTRPGQLAQRH